MDQSLWIRSMDVDDLDAVLALEQRSQPHPWSRELFLQELQRDIALLDVVLQENHLVGYIVCWSMVGELEIQNIVTDPEVRRQGVARKLLRHVLNRASMSGTSRALLEVRAGNQPAIGLYRQFGFMSNGRRPRYYNDGEDAILMCLENPDDSAM